MAPEPAVARVADLYDQLREKIRHATPNAIVSKSLLQALGKTLDSMAAMVAEIDQSDSNFIRLLKEATTLIPPSPEFKRRFAIVNLPYLRALGEIDRRLNRFFGDYVQGLISQLNLNNSNRDEIEGGVTEKLLQLVANLKGMITDEKHNAAKSTAFVFEILQLTLDVLYNHILVCEMEESPDAASGHLRRCEYRDKHFPLLKKVKALVQFHGGQHGINVPEWLKDLDQQLRELLPKEVRQQLDLQAKELEKKRNAKSLEDVMFVVIGIIVFYAFAKYPSSTLSNTELLKAFLPYMVALLIAFIGYVTYCLHGFFYKNGSVHGPVAMQKGPERFDVFLSCRGDILETHAKPLNKALAKAQLKTFFYVNHRNPGRLIKEKLREGVKHSDSAIIIFSRDYVASKWCLYELVLILERMRTSYYPMMPIYCNGVDHKAFENDSIYVKALDDHEAKYGKETVRQWKEALKDIEGREYINSDNQPDLEKFFEQVATHMKKELKRRR